MSDESNKPNQASPKSPSTQSSGNTGERASGSPPTHSTIGDPTRLGFGDRVEESSKKGDSCNSKDEDCGDAKQSKPSEQQGQQKNPGQVQKTQGSSNSGSKPSHGQGESGKKS